MLPDALDRMATLPGQHFRDMANNRVPAFGGGAVDSARLWHDR